MTAKRTVLAILLSGLAPAALVAQTPGLVGYQGRIAVGTTNFDGTGQFRFALTNAGGAVVWSNSPDAAPADGVPDAAVSLAVSKGLYSVLLGDTSITNMATIPTSVWQIGTVRLRVWFNDGVNGTQLLTPDQRLAPTAYLANDSVNTAQIVSNAVTAALCGLDRAASTIRHGHSRGQRKAVGVDRGHALDHPPEGAVFVIERKARREHDDANPHETDDGAGDVEAVRPEAVDHHAPHE